eukprot:TRINITY_DN6202_c0_g1_i1.p1 TRINITY_DN6202_c0_g1~~TRINITY_DN6202_c0_g1_i1.p1  ORF type:complete len:528 (+),score=94.12 TRINITY_DN6202_c0_g1_i1:47-1585(+)
MFQKLWTPKTVQELILSAKSPVVLKEKSQFLELSELLRTPAQDTRKKALLCLQQNINRVSKELLKYVLDKLFDFFLQDNRKEALEAFTQICKTLSQAEQSPSVQDLSSQLVSYLIPRFLDNISQKTIEENVSAINTIATCFPDEMRKSNYRDIKVIGDYLNTGTLLGRGSFGKVFLGRHRRTAKFVAIKEILPSSAQIRDICYKEVQIMKNLSHPNVVQLYDFLEDEHCLYIVMEYCSGGNLETYLQQHPTITEKNAKCIISQTVEGLKYLNAKNIFHRDLKPANLLLHQETSLSSADGFRIKISDFSFSRNLHPKSLTSTICGSYQYMAPEIFAKDSSYDNKSDLWSMGVIIYQILTGKLPYEDNAKSLPIDYVFKVPEDLHLSLNARQLISSLLCADPKKRSTWQDFFGHAFVSSCELVFLKKSVEEQRQVLAQVLLQERLLFEKLMNAPASEDELKREVEELAQENQEQSQLVQEREDVVESLLEILSESRSQLETLHNSCSTQMDKRI